MTGKIRIHSKNVSLFNKTWTRPQITSRENRALASRLFMSLPLHLTFPAQTLIIEDENSNCA